MSAVEQLRRELIADVERLIAERDRLRNAAADLYREDIRESVRRFDAAVAERDAALASLAEERKRAALRDAVVEAAQAWRVARGNGINRTRDALQAAIDALEAGAAAGGEGGT
jgi:hypothetical protein